MFSRKKNLNDQILEFNYPYADKKNSITTNSFFPEEGEMFVFPAWLKHWVYPYKSDVVRVSVSGNIVDNIELKYMSKKGILNAVADIEKHKK